ncbi:MAG: type II toxin-antitoxin system Phd/YefM family antitoxin [Gemmatimonadota bacterium]|nr:type II toxin-antitoxin system Phd/YefM family antitoxin [Gemmatimonadota bacterium]
MTERYSIYDAKAKLSALIRRVREGHSVVITVHGEPVAELRPYQKSERKQTLEERIAELTASGEIMPSRRQPGDPLSFPVGRPVPGALRRFLDERD